MYILLIALHARSVHLMLLVIRVLTQCFVVSVAMILDLMHPLLGTHPCGTGTLIGYQELNEK